MWMGDGGWERGGSERARERERDDLIICLVGLTIFGLRTCSRCGPFASVCIHLQSGPSPVHNFYSTCLRRLVISRFSNLLAGPMVHTMLILGAIMGQKSVQKEAKIIVPATYGKSGFDMLFVMFQPCRASRHNHIFVVIRGAKLGCERRSRKTPLQTHFGSSNGDLAAPRLISGSHFGSLLESSPGKRGWNLHLHPRGFKVASSQC